MQLIENKNQAKRISIPEEPKFLLVTNVLFIAVVCFLVVGLSAVISYPDIAKGELTFVTKNTQILRSAHTGQLHILKRQNEVIKPGNLIAYIKSNESDQYLEKLSNMPSESIPNFGFPAYYYELKKTVYKNSTDYRVDEAFRDYENRFFLTSEEDGVLNYLENIDDLDSVRPSMPLFFIETEMDTFWAIGRIAGDATTKIVPGQIATVTINPDNFLLSGIVSDVISSENEDVAFVKIELDRGLLPKNIFIKILKEESKGIFEITTASKSILHRFLFHH